MAKIKGLVATYGDLSKYSAKAKQGDTYLVGDSVPFTLYSYNTSKEGWIKGDTVSTKAVDLTTRIHVNDLPKLVFEAHDGKTLMIRKGIRLGEIHFYTPEDK